MGGSPSLYRHYVLAILLLIGGANIGDRMILSIMLEPIGREFHASDTALGLLAGVTFAVFYAVFSLPVGFASDRLNRRNIVAAAAALFGAMTMASGLAAKFWQLFVARAVMSIGQSGTEAPSYAMVADLYPPEKRATALAVLQSGGSLGLLITLFFGGVLLQYAGWRVTFLAAGAPALLLSLILLATVREPARGRAEGVQAGEAPAIAAVASFVAGQRSLLLLIAGLALACTSSYGMVSFLPAFLMRSHGLAPMQVGTIVAVLFGVVGGAGLLAAGAVADRLSVRNLKWNLWLPAITLAAGGALMPLLLFAPSLTLALAAAVPAMFFNNMLFAPTFSLAQTLVPLRMRATAMAILLFVLNIVGAGLGPLLVGGLSDLLLPYVGSDALRWAMLATSSIQFAGAACFLFAARRVQSDVTRLADAAPRPAL